jgi:hypothetical protein
MSLPSSPHITNTWTQVIFPIKPGEVNSWRVYAVQRALITRGYTVLSDGDYDPGRGTEKAVRRFQEINRLTVDGIVGPVTQRALLSKVEKVVDERYPNLPNGIVFGLIMKETSGLIAPTNDFDPSPKDVGTDCGCMQWRIKGPPYDFEALKAAFDPELVMERAIVDPDKGLMPRFQRITRVRPTMPLELRWRSVIVAHNAPFLYEQMVKYGRLQTPDAIATWTNNGLGGHFTHQQHFNDYSGDVLAYVH